MSNVLPLRRYGAVLFLFCLFVVVSLLSCVSRPFQPTNATDAYLLSELSYFNLEDPVRSQVIEREFFPEAFSLLPDLSLHSGYYPSQGELLAAHMFYTDLEADKTLVLIHGFGGSARYTIFTYLMQQSIPRGYKVVLLNLPGHEFSGGIRGGIRSFNDYASMVKDFVMYAPSLFEGESVFVGHSTGAVGLMIALQNEEVASVADKMVLMSPYSRLRGDGLLSFLSLFVDASSEDFGVFPVSTVSRDVMNAYKEWNKYAKTYVPLDIDTILVLFAGSDMVINVSHSEKYYREKLPAASFFTYEDQNHTFTSGGYRNVREHLKQYILE